MALEPLIKHPNESLKLAMNFGHQPEIRDAGETLESGSVSAATLTAGAADLIINPASVLPDATLTKITFIVGGGSDLADYRITVSASLSGGNTRKLTGLLQVREASDG
jgi:hypothetical protein